MTQSPPRAATPPTVLVADDDDAVRGSVSTILRHEGYQVTEAGNGDVAVNLLGRDHFDALVVDTRLLRLDGMAVLAAAENPPPAVIMSGTDLDPGGRKDLAVRGIAYLHKPVEAEHLLDAVATAIGRQGRIDRVPARSLNISSPPGVGHKGTEAGTPPDEER